MTEQLQETAFTKVLTCLVLGGYTLVGAKPSWIATVKDAYNASNMQSYRPQPALWGLTVQGQPCVHTRMKGHLQDKERLMLELRDTLVISEQQYIGIRGHIEAQRRLVRHCFLVCYAAILAAVQLWLRLRSMDVCCLTCMQRGIILFQI